MDQRRSDPRLHRLRIGLHMTGWFTDTDPGLEPRRYAPTPRRTYSWVSRATHRRRLTLRKTRQRIRAQFSLTDALGTCDRGPTRP